MKSVPILGYTMISRCVSFCGSQLESVFISMPPIIADKIIMLSSYFSFNQISFNTCQPCLTWPSTSSNDDANGDLDDQFDYYHQYDSKMCSAAQHYKQSCGWGCKKKAKVQSSSSSYSSSSQAKHSWNGFEKFFLFFWSFCGEYYLFPWTIFGYLV